MEMTYIDAPADLTMRIGEAMFTQRAIRRLRSDKPVSDADLKTILDAASKAPNGGNSQPARFLVIRDRDTIEAFGKLYHEAWWAKRRDEYGWKGKADIPEGSVYSMPALLADAASARGTSEDVVLAEFKDRSPIGHLVTIDEVGWAVETLLAPEARSLAGGTLLLDSGQRTAFP